MVNQMNLERARGVFTKLIALFELGHLPQLVPDRAISHPDILRLKVLLIAESRNDGNALMNDLSMSYVLLSVLTDQRSTEDSRRS